MSLAQIVPEAADTPRDDLRGARYAALRRLWGVTSLERVAYCRRALSEGSGGVSVLLTGQAGTPDARAGFSGLQTCGSVWACPVCSERVNAERRAELVRGMDAWLASGNSVEFATLTLQHGRGQTLRRLWDVVVKGYGAVTSGAGWVGGRRQAGFRAEFHVEGVVRLVEVKVGEHGWHPHLHLLVFIRGESMSDVRREQFRSRLFGRWETALAARGARTLETAWDGQHVGCDVRPVLESAYVAEYLTKTGYRPVGTPVTGAAFEVTGSHAKLAGKGGRTPFEVLAALVECDAMRYDPDAGELVDRRTGELLAVDDVRRYDAALWHEWEQTSKGRRQLTWSHGLRDTLRLGAELSDDEVVDEDLAGDVVFTISAEAWRAGYLAARQAEILGIAEAYGARGLSDWWISEGFAGP